MLLYLEVDGGGRDLLGVGLEAVAEVAPVRQVQAHDTVMRVQQGSVDLMRAGGGAGAPHTASSVHSNISQGHESKAFEQQRRLHPAQPNSA